MTRSHNSSDDLPAHAFANAFDFFKKMSHPKYLLLRIMRQQQPDFLSSVLDRDFSVLIVGSGESAQGMLSWCMQQTQRVKLYITDTRAHACATLRKQFEHSALPKNVQIFVLSFEDALAMLTQITHNVDFVWLSPGLSPLQTAIHTLLLTCESHKHYITSELDVFYYAFQKIQHQQQSTTTKAKKSAHILAITGTNGKTTTTQLTKHILREHGINAVVAGNISPSMLQQLCNIEQHNHDQAHAAAYPDVWVLELSSFQLALSNYFIADAAIVLNITEDHLDWHVDMHEYIAAKLRIFSQKTFNIAYFEDELSQEQLNKMHQTSSKTNPHTHNMHFISKMPPTAKANWGIIRQGAQAHLAHYDLKTHTTQALLACDALNIHGVHNSLNALAALALCQVLTQSLKINMHILLKGLSSYVGEPHRVQYLGLMPNQAHAYDDSKGTNVGATLAAIEGLSQSITARASANDSLNQLANTRHIVLIAGGDAKGQDFTPLKAATQYVKHLHIIGLDQSHLINLAQSTQTPYTCHAYLEQATRAAYLDACAGEIILLSPACASLDMFKNYVHRAEVFVDALAAIKNEPHTSNNTITI